MGTGANGSVEESIVSVLGRSKCAKNWAWVTRQPLRMSAQSPRLGRTILGLSMSRAPHGTGGNLSRPYETPTVRLAHLRADSLLSGSRTAASSPRTWIEILITGGEKPSPNPKLYWVLEASSPGRLALADPIPANGYIWSPVPNVSIAFAPNEVTSMPLRL